MSLLIGLRLWTGSGLPTLLFGMGSGLCSVAISDRYGLEAVWSVLLTYIYETGIVGAISVCWVARHLAHVWRITGFSLGFAGFFFVWLVGVTVTTSYSQLLPIWLALGWMIVWPSVCARRGIGPRGRGPEPRNRLHAAPQTPDASSPPRIDDELAMTPWSRHL